VTREGTSEALQLFYRAIDLDKSFAPPHAVAVLCICRQKSHGWAADREHAIAETERLARRAVQLDSEDAPLSRIGYGLAFVVGDLDRGAALIDRALSLSL
jgi:adenylate cyclase